MKNQPLRHQFRLWTISLVVVPSLLVMGIYTVSQISVAKKQNLELISERVHSQKRLIDYWMAERAANVRELSQIKAFRNLDEQQMQSALDLKQQHDKNFDSLSYIGKDGYFKMSTLSRPIQYSSAIGRPYFEEALAGKEYISDVVIGRNSGLPIINVSSPIYDDTGIFQGAILGSISTATLETLLRESWIGQTGEVFLVNREGTMLTELRYVNVLVDKGLIEGTAKMNFKITKDAFGNIQLGQSGTAEWIDYRGNKVLGAYLDVPNQNWTFIGKIDEAEVLFPIYQQLAMMAVGIIILVLLILPLATLITNRIKYPIDWLIRQSNLVAAEEYHMVGRDNSLEKMPRELRELCETFIKMNSKIGDTVSLLKENEARLEDEVNRQIGDRIQTLARFELLFQNNLAAMAVVNLPDQTCIDVNLAWERLTGFSRDTVVGRNVMVLGIADQSSANNQILWQELQLKGFVSGEYDLRTKNGEDKKTVCSMIILDNDKEQQYLTTFIDVTDQRRMEAEIAQIDRLNVVGEMAVGIGHEIRNPMTTVRGYLQLFQRKTEFLKYHGQIRIMIEELDRANRIITEFLSLAKDKAVEMKCGNLNHVIYALHPLIQADALLRGHDIKLEIGDIPDSIFDEKDISHLTLNLVRNALEAMERRGIVTIRTYLERGQIMLAIQDTGPGISGEILAKLGTPFVTTKDEATGLGLPVCFRVADRHGAKIRIDTGAMGTTVIVKFISSEGNAEKTFNNA